MAASSSKRPLRIGPEVGGMSAFRAKRPRVACVRFASRPGQGAARATARRERVCFLGAKSTKVDADVQSSERSSRACGSMSALHPERQGRWPRRDRSLDQGRGEAAHATSSAPTRGAPAPTLAASHDAAECPRGANERRLHEDVAAHIANSEHHESAGATAHARRPYAAETGCECRPMSSSSASSSPLPRACPSRARPVGWARQAERSAPPTCAPAHANRWFVGRQAA